MKFNTVVGCFAMFTENICSDQGSDQCKKCDNYIFDLYLVYVNSCCSTMFCNNFSIYVTNISFYVLRYASVLIVCLF